MRKQLRMLASFGLVSATLWLVPTSVAGQQPSTRPDLSGTANQQGHLKPIRVQVPEGLSVTVEGPSALSDAVSYRSGDRFVVIIPQAFVKSFESDVSGRAFTSMQIEQRGDDVAISFRLRPGATARVVPKASGLEVAFTLEVAALRSDDNAGDAGSQPILAPPPAPKAPPSSASPTTQPSVPASMPVVPPTTPFQLGDLLKLIPGMTPDMKADVSNIDLSVPESPAFTVLGVTPNAVVRPGTPREFATSLLNGLDKNGNFQTGLAIDTAPFMLFNGQNITLQDYNDYYLTRLLSRTQFSMATIKGGSRDDTAMRLALGLNLTLWDKGDARVYHPKRGPEGDVLTCFKANIKPPEAPSSANPTQDEINQINARAKALNDKAADTCRDKVRKANWNRTSWTIAYAPSWITKNGQNTNFQWNGGAFWTSFAYGFDGVPSLSKIGQLILNARYRTKEQVADPARAGQFLSQNSTFFGGRFRAGNPDFAFNIESAYIRNQPFGRNAISSNRFSFGAEIRVSNNLYIVVTGGSGPSDGGGDKKGFFLSSFKYGFNKKSQLNPQP